MKLPDITPRWRPSRFGGCLELLVGSRWIGTVEPAIGGVHRYRGWNCAGEAATLDEAKAAVEASITSGEKT